jgi:aryl-alcohol dehydrogenase-like predicted oxidoreductase
VPEAYSLLNQTAVAEIFPTAERLGMGVVVAVPLEKGLLATGATGQDRLPLVRDWDRRQHRQPEGAV